MISGRLVTHSIRLGACGRELNTRDQVHFRTLTRCEGGETTVVRPSPPFVATPSTPRRVPSSKSLRDDTEAFASMLYGVFHDIPSEQHDNAVREFAERLAEIHEVHGQGVPEWLVRLRARFQT